MYRCPECDRTFEYPDYVERCFEDMCGVSSVFPDKHYGTFAECPYCGGPIDVYEDEVYEDEDEYE